MLNTLAVLLPVFLLIAAGYLARRMNFPGEGFWNQAAKLTYWVFVPALLIRVLAKIKLEADWFSISFMAITAICGTALISWLLYLMHRKLRTDPGGQALDGPGFSSVLQGAVRHNTYIALALAAGAFDEQELAYLIILLAITTPLVNIIAVLGLISYGRSTRESEAKRRQSEAFKALMTNPFILACALGLFLGYYELQLPDLLNETIDLLAQPALSLGLLVVGAGLRLKGLLPRWPLLVSASSLRLLLYPGIALGLSDLFAVNDQQFAALMLFAALPTASSAYVLALEMGGDEQLMAEIITVQTLLSALTMPWVMTW